MNFAITPVQPASVLPRFSHRLARGLRRELFREFHDRDRQWQALAPTVSLMATANLATRERVKILRRLAPRMRVSLTAYHEHSSSNTFLAGGTSLLPVEQIYAGEQTEDVLTANKIQVLVDGRRVGVSNKPVALISQHAIERIFERLGTTDHAVTRTELASALAWFDLLHSTCLSLSHQSRIRQFAAPTATGAFLGQYCHDNGLLQIRTWVPSGNNNRIDRTLAALHAWRATPTNDTTSTFRSLLAQPCNQWMGQPYFRSY